MRVGELNRKNCRKIYEVEIMGEWIKLTVSIERDVKEE